MDFGSGTTVIDGRQIPTELSPTRHPVLDVLGTGSADDWNTPELRELRQVLREEPHSLALWQRARMSNHLRRMTPTVRRRSRMHPFIRWQSQNLS